MFIFCILILGCDDPIVLKFKNQPKGANPKELIGEFTVLWEEDSVIQEGFFTFSYLGKRQYLLTDPDQDTVFQGRIVRKKQDYFLSNELKEGGHYDITSFRLVGDSAYNFWDAIYWGNKEQAIIDGGFFKKYEKVVQDEREIYYIDNKAKETHKAFAAMNDQAMKSPGLFFKKVEVIAEDGKEIEIEEESAIADENIEEALRLDIYPNPFAERLTLEMNQMTEGKAELFLLSGQMVASETFRTTQFDWQLPELAAGVYVLRVSDAHGELLKTDKVIKR